MERRQYQFRINGVIMPYLRIQYETSDEVGVERRRIAVDDDQIGWIVIDDNEDLADPALSKFVLEVRDFVAPAEHRRLLNGGWRKASTQELLALLEGAGIIRCE